MADKNQRHLEPGIVSDFSDKLSYFGYLSLEGLARVGIRLSYQFHLLISSVQ